MTDFYDDLERRDPADREAALFAKLREFLPRVLAGAPGWARLLKDLDPGTLKTPDDLAGLPVLRKSELKDLQEKNPPFAGFTMGDTADFGRIFMSPGPIFEPMGTEPDPWRAARALYAAGFRDGTLVHNAFAYHLTPGGFLVDAGLRAVGCTVIPAGIGNTEMQIDVIAQLKPEGYAGTPDYLKVLLDKAAELGKETSSIKRGLVSGGALFPSLRAEYAERGISVLQCYATADVGLIAYESEAAEGMIADEDIILEIVRPGTGEPVAPGEVGEVVVTTFNPVYPMIRFGTGDLSAIMEGPSPCGRTNTRIKGWMGRADQTTKVKGMFVHPSQIADVGRRHGELGRLRLVVARDGEQDAMMLQAECASPSADLADAVAASLQAVCKVRGSVDLVAPGSLANDGKVIDDQRSYE
ncbi:MAG: AMP-binding protein [Hyphomicrobiales bacterium]|nr:AMP-binding protein [Hyphomicrobiales bacterium]